MEEYSSLLSSKNTTSASTSGSSRAGRVERRRKHKNRKVKSQKSSPQRRKRSPISSAETSSDGSTSTSRSSSSSESSSSSSEGSTTSSSVPSVKLRLKKKKEVHNIKEFRNDKERQLKRQQQIDFERKRESDRTPKSQPSRPESLPKRNPSPHSRSDDRKTTRYDPPLGTPRKPSPLRKISTPILYHQRGREREVPEPPVRERIRIVPSSASGRLPPESISRFLGSSIQHQPQVPRPHPENRNYQDFRNEEKRGRERLAPARTPPTRDRIPPLLPDNDRMLRRPPPPFLHHQERPTGFNFPRRQPLLPDRWEPIIPPLRTFPEKRPLEVPTITSLTKSRVDVWVGETLKSPLKIEKEEVLSEISDDDDEEAVVLASEKIELEVTSTLVEEGGGSAHVRVESQTEDSILESMDFEEISDDELEEGVSGKKMGIVDALGVDWSILLRGKVTNEKNSEIRRRESTLVDILKRTGLQKSLVKESLFAEILERVGEAEVRAGCNHCAIAEELENPFIRRQRLEREEFVDNLGLGPGSRALSARRDFAMRRYLLDLESMPLECLDLNPLVSLQLKKNTLEGDRL